MTEVVALLAEAILHLAVVVCSPGREASEVVCPAHSAPVVASRTGADSFLVRFRLPGSFGLSL